MKIEVLFPEICNLYGDTGNAKYLSACIPDAKIIITSIDDIPYFAQNNDVDMIYIGGMPEKKQGLVASKLYPYNEALKNHIGNNKAMLATSNALEIFGDYIEDEKGEQVQTLGIFDFFSKVNKSKRHNSIYLGEYENIEIVGYKSQFGMSYANDENKFFSSVVKGIGVNESSKYEGFKINKFIATYLIGPLLVLNPYLTEKLLVSMGVETPKLAYRDEAIAAYNKRLKEFKE